MPHGWSQPSRFDQQALNKLFMSSPQTTSCLQTLKGEGLSVGNTKCLYFLEMPNESPCFPSKCIFALGAPYTKIHSCKESSSAVWCAERLETIIILVRKPHLLPRRGHSILPAVRHRGYCDPSSTPAHGAAPSQGKLSLPVDLWQEDVLPFTRWEAWGVGLPRKRHLGRPGNSLSESPVHLEKGPPACRQLAKKEGKERKLPNKVVHSDGSPSPHHNLPSPRICCCNWNVTNQAMGTVHVGRARLFLQRGDGWAPRGPAAGAYVSAAQTGSALRPLPFETVW